MSPAIPPTVELRALVPQKKYLLVFSDPEMEVIPFEVLFVRKQTEYAYYTQDGGVDPENMYVFQRVHSSTSDDEFVWYYERDFDGVIDIHAIDETADE